MSYRNSYYCGPRQFDLLETPNISVTNLAALTPTDYLRFRARNWLHDGDNDAPVNGTLNMEREPSPDGVNYGQMTWYGYPNKPKGANGWELPLVIGDQFQPSYVARFLPDGQLQYTYRKYDSLGNVTLKADTYSSENKTGIYSVGNEVGLRTNTYVYSGPDLIRETGPDGTVEATYSYNGFHKVLSRANALGETTTYTYNDNQQVASMTTPTGLVTKNTYQNGWLTTTIDYMGSVALRTNSYTYEKNRVKTITDERGLTTEYFRDALGRVTGMKFPDGTTISNVYTTLDVTAAKDRLGNWTYFEFDSMHRRTKVTDANNHSTFSTYCTCGSLESVVDPLGNTTFFKYDDAGRLTNTVYPDNNCLTRSYNSVNQITNVTDGTTWTSYFYNNQGLQYAASNAAGQVFFREYDIRDRVTRSVDQNGVAAAMAYDALDRMVLRTMPDGWPETFDYSPFGQTVYINQIGNITRYGYDAARRKIAETNANNQITRYQYNAAGDLIALTDGNNNTTKWDVDEYGRNISKTDAAGTVILKYQHDANGRLITRWSAEKGNTTYGYDAVGNITSVGYPTGTPSLAFTFDAANRLVNMQDGVGTTVYTYTPAGLLASETDPWNNTVSYEYNNSRQRSKLLMNGQDVNTYSYDQSGRLLGIHSADAGNFVYGYNPGLGGHLTASALLDYINITDGNNNNLGKIQNVYDGNGRQTSTAMGNNGATLDYYGCTYNAASQRTSAVRKGGAAYSGVNYTYDPLGQLLSSMAHELNGTPRASEQLTYQYDSAGNLKTRANNGNPTTFNVNKLNQLTTVAAPSATVASGATSGRAVGVSVNGVKGNLFSDGTFVALAGC